MLPGVCDTRSEEEGGNPRFWTGLRPATPTNIPYIGRTKVGRLWVNAGHGTLGWTHGAGSGKALAELIDERRPELRLRLLRHADAAASLLRRLNQSSFSPVSYSVSRPMRSSTSSAVQGSISEPQRLSR